MKKICSSLLIFVFFSAFLSACGSSALQPTATAKPSETRLPTFTVTPVPTNTLTPTNMPIIPTQTLSAFPEIKTVEGTLIINEVELANQDMFGAPAPDGKQFLTIELVRSDGVDIDVVYFLKVQPISPEIYLVSSDGTRSQISGFSYWEGKLFVRFTVLNNMSGFQFFWPNNSLIGLGK